MKRTHLPVILGVATLIAVISRCFQLLAMTEPGTGFIISEYKFFGNAVTVFIFALLLSVCLAASMVKVRNSKETYSYGFLAVSVAAAVSAVLETGMLSYYQVLPIVVRVLALVVALAAGVVLVLFSLSKVFNVAFPNVLLSVVCVYGFARLMLAFVSTSKIVTINDNIYELGFLCVSLLFWLYFGQLHAGASNEKTAGKMFVTGVAAFCLSVVSAVPKIVMLILKRHDLIYNGTTSTFTDLLLGICILYAAYEVEE